MNFRRMINISSHAPNIISFDICPKFKFRWVSVRLLAQAQGKMAPRPFFFSLTREQLLTLVCAVLLSLLQLVKTMDQNIRVSGES